MRGGVFSGRSWNRAGSANRYVLYAIVLAGVGVTLLVRGMSGRQGGGVTWEEAPPETRGVWTTDNERYAGRSISVAPATVTLGLGAAGSSILGDVEIARELLDGDERIIRVEYVTQQGPDALDMVIAPDGSMHLANQPDVVWRVDPNTVVPPPPTETTRPSGPGLRIDPTLVGALLILGLAALLLRLRSGEPATEAPRPGATPTWLRGVWTTPDPKYAGHTMRIASHYGYEQFGPGDIRIGGEITSVRSWREEGGRGVRLEYRSHEGPREFEVVIDRAGHLRFKDGPRSVFVLRDA